MNRLIPKCLLKACLFVFLISFYSSIALAQSNYYQEANQPNEGYWRILTDYTRRSTLIKFYNRENLLVYEEIIPGKYIKLTKRNIRLINQELKRLIGNQLVASKLKSIDLFADNRRSYLDMPSELLREELKLSKTLYEVSFPNLHVNMHLSTKSTKLKVIFRNPQLEQVHIVIKDEQNSIVYHETTSLHAFNRDYYLGKMATGMYTFEIKGRNTKFTRKIWVKYADDKHYLQLIPQKTDFNTAQSL